MKRVILAIAVLGVMGVALVGCRASGEIGDSTSVVAPR
jgi:hypothetical protein